MDILCLILAFVLGLALGIGVMSGLTLIQNADKIKKQIQIGGSNCNQTQIQRNDDKLKENLPNQI